MNTTQVYLLEGYGWECRVAPRWGMNPFSLCYRGEPVLRAPETTEELAARPCVYGSALLLPANRTENGCFTFEGIQYRLPLNDPAGNNHVHGFVNRAAFTVESADELHICARLENEGALYPFPFRLEAEYAVTPTGFRQTFRITNTGAGRMPFTFGLHTNFAEKAHFSAPIRQRWEKNAQHIPTGRLLPLDERELAYANGFVPDGKPVTGLFTASGHRATIGDFTYEVSENFDQWVLWNGDAAQKFVSIEPQCGAVNALNSGAGLRILEPHQTETFHTCIHNPAR